MKIAVESTVCLQPQNKRRLEKIGKVIRYKWGCNKEEFFEAAKDCEIIIANKWFFNELLPKLKVKLISLWSTGTDLINIEQCKKLGIAVTNVPSYSTNSVAELAIALIMELTKKISYQNKELLDGKWAYDLPLMTELKGKTLGIIGFGNIGSKVAEIGKALDMEIRVYIRKNKQKDFPEYKFVSLDELLKNSDFVTIHAPLNNETKHLMNKNNLKKMKKTAFIINCSRGAIINQEDLIKALKSKTIAGAGLDVFEKEPLPMDSELRKLDNVVMTPHNAFYTKEAVGRLTTICVDNILNYLDGKDSNVVNK
ncbi:MAG: NAD(P)-dependent oxidoreductase [Nanoarchaeota archaeon]